ncbi:MAG: septum formation initiator family protein [Clostridia bacterium]|nr:septum formation initiator family protein [Clostridia bacterium]MEE1025264.1 septum formation initiator family protein [Acutalibacteraceae bacterium]
MAKKTIIFPIALLLFSAYMIYAMIMLQTELAENKKILAEKQAQISELQVSNEELSELLNNGSQKELIERAAREKLGFVYANEEIYEDISGK